MIPKPKTVKNRVAKEWLKFRRQWLKDNPPNHQGYYLCGICGMWVHQGEMELDHILNRSTHPHLRLEVSNVRPVHHTCNTQKKIRP